MNNIIKYIKGLFSLVLGYLLIPGLYLGFILSTNSTKGWNVKNGDGALFIPIGIIILITSFLVIISHIICLFSAIKNKNRTKYIFFSFYLFGIVLYLIDWCIS